MYAHVVGCGLKNSTLVKKHSAEDVSFRDILMLNKMSAKQKVLKLTTPKGEVII